MIIKFYADTIELLMQADGTDLIIVSPDIDALKALAKETHKTIVEPISYVVFLDRSRWHWRKPPGFLIDQLDQFLLHISEETTIKGVTLEKRSVSSPMTHYEQLMWL